MPAGPRFLLALALACAPVLTPAHAGEAAAIDRTLPTAQVPEAGAAWWSDVAEISLPGARNPGRREAIDRLLNAAGLTAAATAFTRKDLDGVNLIAPVSGDSEQPLLLLGAHYDQVDIGNGVTDNASGSAVVLALARRFQQRPLRNHRVAAAFWDLEEKGLLGASAYVEDGGERPALYVNFDVFGWGDTLWMMTPDATHPLVEASAAGARAHGLALSSGDRYPPTDHLAFLKADWPAVSYSLVGSDEIAPILQMFAGTTPDAAPKVMRVIHSADDTLEQVDPHAVAAAIDAVEAALRRWDEGLHVH